jgi:hypothetical protein
VSELASGIHLVVTAGGFLIGLGLKTERATAAATRITLKSPAIWSPVPLMGETRGPGGGRRNAMVGQADMLLWLPVDEIELYGIAVALLEDDGELAKHYRAAKAQRAGLVTPPSA